MKKAAITLIAMTISFSMHAKEEDKNERISFILGMGTSYIATNLYKDPAIDKATNNVIIEEAGRGKASATIGIAYTPYLRTITNQKGSFVVPYGPTFASFFNPLNITAASEKGSKFDFGIGLGWKFASGIMIMATSDFFYMNQPNEWFVDKYKGNDQQYLLNNVPQSALDLNDNSIMHDKLAISFGFKVCYTFDLVRSYKTSREAAAEKAR